VSPVWVGQVGVPAFRVATLARALVGFRPHILQSAHFYTNLYVSLVAPLYRAMPIGSIRSDTHYNVSSSGFWGPWLLRIPRALIANSYAARRNAESLGVNRETIWVVPNVVDATEFQPTSSLRARPGDEVVVAAVASQVPVKRLDRFLAAVALARAQVPTLTGVLVGDGPERKRLEAIACQLNLLPGGVRFLGRRDHVAEALRAADMLVVSSDHEGFPNVILEAMAAQLPVVTTPAGDAEVVVRDGVTGYVVPFDDVEQMAERMVRLARSPRLREELGGAGRVRVEHLYTVDRLSDAVLSTYLAIARKQAQRGIVDVILASARAHAQASCL